MSDRWSKASVALHWLGAGLIAGLATAGFVMSDLPADSELRLLLSRLHSASGFALMFLTVIRLVVRRGAAPAPLAVSELHRRGIRAVHGLIYATTFALGASGVATAARSAWPSYLRGELSARPELEHLGSLELHGALVFTLLGLIALHVGGVLVQQLRKGGTLRRMVPFLG